MTRLTDSIMIEVGILPRSQLVGSRLMKLTSGRTGFLPGRAIASCRRSIHLQGG